MNNNFILPPPPRSLLVRIRVWLSMLRYPKCQSPVSLEDFGYGKA